MKNNLTYGGCDTPVGEVARGIYLNYLVFQFLPNLLKSYEGWFLAKVSFKTETIQGNIFFV